jgi:hypothetical protein
VVKYHATINDVKYVKYAYGPTAPVAHVRPRDVIDTNTLDAFGNVLKKPGDKLSLVCLDTAGTSACATSAGGV